MVTKWYSWKPKPTISPQRFDSLRTDITIAGMKSAIAEMRSTIAGMRSAIAKMRSTIAGMRSAIAKMKSTIVGMSSAIAEMTSTVSEMKSENIKKGNEPQSPPRHRGKGKDENKEIERINHEVHRSGSVYTIPIKNACVFRARRLKISLFFLRGLRALRGRNINF